MGNAVGEGRERERVGPQIHLALSVADRERGVPSRAPISRFSSPSNR
jgi:hypothetical protein